MHCAAGVSRVPFAIYSVDHDSNRLFDEMPLHDLPLGPQPLQKVPAGSVPKHQLRTATQTLRKSTKFQASPETLKQTTVNVHNTTRYHVTKAQSHARQYAYEHAHDRIQQWRIQAQNKTEAPVSGMDPGRKNFCLFEENRRVSLRDYVVGEGQQSFLIN